MRLDHNHHHFGLLPPTNNGRTSIVSFSFVVVVVVVVTEVIKLSPGHTNKGSPVPFDEARFLNPPRNQIRCEAAGGGLRAQLEANLLPSEMGSKELNEARDNYLKLIEIAFFVTDGLVNVFRAEPGKNRFASSFDPGLFHAQGAFPVLDEPKINIFQCHFYFHPRFLLHKKNLCRGPISVLHLVGTSPEVS